MNWFDVDKKGLAKLMAGRSKSFVLYELLQNAWDQNVTEVNVTIAPIEGVPMTEIIVEDDDPEGFADLAHAYTLFAESQKKTDAEKRGRFNIGEKLVLALAREALIETTKGTVQFNATGRHETRSRRAAGSCITVDLPMTRAEHAELMDAAYRIIVPQKIKTTINGQIVPKRKPIAEFETTLPTLLSDNEGVMRPTSRKTTVRVYEPAANEPATLFEMGIPVVETGDRFHVDVQQKVPLNMDRDNVTPGYLRVIRVAVLNAVHDRITKDDAAETWVKEACSDERVDDAAVRRAVGLRFGENSVAYDPSDPEANSLAVADGRQVVYGGHLSGGEWAMAKRAGVLPAAGVVTPSPKPYSPDGRPINLIHESEWTPGMRRVADFAKIVGLKVCKANVHVQIAREIDWPVMGTYGPIGSANVAGIRPGELMINLMRVGHDFFNQGISREVIDFIIHEFGHHYSCNHLSEEYYDALTWIGSQMVLLAIAEPELFQ